MKLELFSESKWAILKEISNRPQSPLDLSEKFDTTISNITQQLKLLEYSGLVGKKKAKEKRPGKAKTLYNVKGTRNFLISLGQNGAKKTELKKDYHQMLTTSIWLYAPEKDRYFLEKFFWENEQVIKKVEKIILVPNKQKISLVLITAKKLLNIKLKIADSNNNTRDFSVIQKESYSRSRGELVLLNKNGGGDAD
ncbi:hypothetical protein C0585_04115 [Candidatus Woesearchaeota archaeon]|nr:MAG: hypothetical protein C0585_04115 [Candidatus Woesearchaeota archaeon]